MDKETLKALLDEINHWERIAEGKEVDRCAGNSPLCWRYYTPTSCSGCPVSEKTKNDVCRRTPYIDWAEHQNAKHGGVFPFAVRCEDCKRLAQKEVDFLKSLLPKGGEDEMRLRRGYLIASLVGLFTFALVYITDISEYVAFAGTVMAIAIYADLCYERKEAGQHGKD